jgi:hypothetical protein
MAIPRSVIGKLRLCCALLVFAAGLAKAYGQLASEELVMRSYQLLPATNILVPAPMQHRNEQIETMFADMGIALWGDPAARTDRESHKTYLYNEQTGLLTVWATLADVEKLEPALRVITGSRTIRIVTAAEARRRIENAPTSSRQIPPRLPKDTRPDADPTPHNAGRLPFPPTFVPEGTRSGAPR